MEDVDNWWEEQQVFWIKTKNMDDYVLLESEKEFCELSNQIERT